MALLGLLVFGARAGRAAEPEAAAPKPSVQISFSKQSIRENDQIEIHVWVANEGDQQLTSLSLHVAGPGFLKWYADDCAGAAFSSPRDLGALPANETRRFDLCVRSDSTVVVGDFNILFAFEYTWQKSGKGGHTFVTTEKPLKATLLGSDTVAGVPLTLAGYVVPGLFFWLVLSVYWKPPWSVDLALGDKMIYSILVSVGVIVLAWLVSYAVASLGVVRARHWNDYFDVSAGISVVKLLVLSGVGLLLGVVVGAFDAWRRQRQIASVTIKAGDDDYVKIEKLLRLRPDYAALVKQQPGYCPLTTVQFKSGDEYQCSLYVKSGDTTWLFGWFAITLDPARPGVTQKLKEYEARGELLPMLRYARKQGLLLDERNLIQQVIGGNPTPTGGATLPIQNDEVKNATGGEDKGKGKLVELKN